MLLAINATSFFLADIDVDVLPVSVLPSVSLPFSFVAVTLLVDGTASDSCFADPCSVLPVSVLLDVLLPFSLTVYAVPNCVSVLAADELLPVFSVSANADDANPEHTISTQTTRAMIARAYTVLFLPFSLITEYSL
ncbi:MAG: hypothetical protein LKH31_03920 [Eubacterium sp.]|nr:hypothetical protein [Eubacterium sp.]